MENNATNFDRIEAYLFGQMSAADTVAFEQEISRDKTLALEVERQQLEHRAMELLHREALRSNMQSWKTEQDEEDISEGGRPGAKVVSMPFTRRLVYRIAAAAGIVLAIGFFSRQFFSGGDDNAAFAMAEFGHSDLGGDRGNGTDNDPLSIAYRALSKKDYRTALSHLEQVQAADQALTVLNLRGECYFYLKDFPQAAATYRQLLENKSAEGDLREKAEWRLLLSLLAQGGQETEVKRMLDTVIAGGGQFEGKARELKGKI